MSDQENTKEHIEIVQNFYEAFQKRDAETMVELYHDEVILKDPAFGTLKGEHAKNMWRMLCQNAKDLQINAHNFLASENKVSCTWNAQYTFQQTGNVVKNTINAIFEFKDDKIYRHMDDFNLHEWAGQAIGFKGWLIGWSSYFQKKLQEQTNRLLLKFEKNEGSR